jgi:hypothetical protein
MKRDNTKKSRLNGKVIQICTKIALNPGFSVNTGHLKAKFLHLIYMVQCENGSITQFENAK